MITFVSIIMLLCAGGLFWSMYELIIGRATKKAKQLYPNPTIKEKVSIPQVVKIPIKFKTHWFAFWVFLILGGMTYFSWFVFIALALLISNIYAGYRQDRYEDLLSLIR